MLQGGSAKQRRKKRSLRLFGHKKAKNYDSKDYDPEPPVMPPAGTAVLHFFLFLFVSAVDPGIAKGCTMASAQSRAPIGSRGRENLPPCLRQSASCSHKPTTNLSVGQGDPTGLPIAGSTTGLFVIYTFLHCVSCLCFAVC